VIVALVRHDRFAQPLHGAGCVAVAHAHERGAQAIISNDDPAAPGISVEVDDVDAVHSAAVERGLEIAIPGARLLRLEGAGHGVDRADWEVVVEAILEHT
jgi:pimeloyl-ACP methyl ester carboxylesterase